MERTLAARTRESRFHGLLVVDKPGDPAPGAAQSGPHAPTSHDVVQMVRRWSGQRRIGHTGTLDPMASGVLVLCLGRAARLVEYYQNHDKQYYAELALGAATDTYDAAGAVTAEAPVPMLDRGSLDEVLAQFRGDILQTPPAYSAIKQKGEALYRKARRGETVQIEPRRVAIRQLDLLDYQPGRRLCLRVVCSAGAYIRSLAHDIGIALDSYAHLALLRREAAGPFSLADAHSLEETAAAAEAGQFAALLRPPGDGLDLPALRLAADTLTRLGYGQIVALPFAPPARKPAGCAENQLALALTEDGGFAGIVRCLGPAETSQAGCLWKAEKWLTTS
jgi:tRNA pseudouridine55 synthase